MSLKEEYYAQLQGIIPTEQLAKEEHPYFFPGDDEPKEWAIYQIMLKYIPFANISNINGNSREADGGTMYHYSTAMAVYLRDIEGSITAAEAVNIQTLLNTARMELHNGQWYTTQLLINAQLGNFNPAELAIVTWLKTHTDNYLTNYYGA